MKEILIITSYYPPEIGAASNRIFHLAEGLQKNNFNVSVITPLPNYPKGEIFDGYKNKFRHTSIEKNIKLYRLWIYATVSKNKFIRLFAMLSYSFSLVWFFIFNKIPKTVVIQSPPLLVAFTSVFFLRSKQRRLILNVSDLWPIAGIELGVFKKNYGYKLLQKIEYFNYKNANLILGQSDEILVHVKSLFPNKSTFLYRNYPNFKPPEADVISRSKKKIKMVYAGLLGVAQGVFKLCQNLEYQNLEFHIYGSGSELKQIKKFALENQNLPIFLHGEISREQLHHEILKYDLAIVPLKNRIYGSVPSKIFEYAKLGLPIIYFGGGEGEDIIEKYSLGWVAQSGNYENLNEMINSIREIGIENEYRKNIKNKASNLFNLDKQIIQLIDKF